MNFANLKFTLKAALAVIAGGIGLCWLTGAAAELFGWPLPQQGQVELVRQYLLSAGRRLGEVPVWRWAVLGDFWVLMRLVATILVMAPVLEETVFRGLCWRWLRPGRPVLAAAVSSVLFAGVHYLGNPWPDNAFAALFFIGMAHCLIYARTGCIFWPMLSHALFNAANLALVLAMPD